MSLSAFVVAVSLDVSSSSSLAAAGDAETGTALVEAGTAIAAGSTGGVAALRRPTDDRITVGNKFLCVYDCMFNPSVILQ